jgi:hypothetical protein
MPCNDCLWDDIVTADKEGRLTQEVADKLLERLNKRQADIEKELSLLAKLEDPDLGLNTLSCMDLLTCATVCICICVCGCVAGERCECDCTTCCIYLKVYSSSTRSACLRWVV